MSEEKKRKEKNKVTILQEHQKSKKKGKIVSMMFKDLCQFSHTNKNKVTQARARRVTTNKF